MADNSRTQFPPGTILLQDLVHDEIILQPQPSNDPNDPLRWSTVRKTINFSLVLYFSLMTFVLVDIGPISWGPVSEELPINFQDLNNSFAAALAGLGAGSILAIPLTYRYGRRPVYLVCIVLQLAGSVWQAKTMTAGDIIGSNVLCGVAGAAAESIVQLTIYDLFYVHQRGLMNGIYLLSSMAGAFLSLVPAGYIVESQGWRWSWWWTTILIGAGGIAFFFFFEESKFVPCSLGQQASNVDDQESSDKKEDKKALGSPDSGSQTTRVASRQVGSYSAKKSLKERFAFATPTDVPFLPLVVLPFRLFFLFPAVFYVCFTYGTLLSWYSVIASTQSTYLLLEPYNFGAISVGLFNIAPFIGSMVGSVIGGPLSDWLIVLKSKRNDGIYEPETRLWLAIPCIIILPAGILLYGLSLAAGMPWIVPAVGAAIFSIGFGVLATVSMSYLIDCYEEVVGFAFVAVAFVRNSLSMVIVFALTPWLEFDGLRDVLIITACLSCALAAFSIPMIIWGKHARIRTAAAYRAVAVDVPSHRMHNNGHM